MLLIHGWDYKNYSSQTKGEDVWGNRRDFVEELKKHYDIKVITLPGFCGKKEPDRPWQLEDFADFVEQELNKENYIPDYVLGYSFGGAVALKHKLKYNKNKIILVSPAISRKYKTEAVAHNKLKYFTKFLPDFVNDLLRDQYISRILKNPFYSKGTSFLKKTYLNIVGLDLSEQLKLLNRNDFKIVFGENDTATPPDVLLKKVPELSKNIVILPKGTHDIANTNTDELVNEIIKFTNVGETYIKLRKNNSNEI